MTFLQAILTCFRKYITFSGRAARSEFWWFVLFILLANIVLSILDTILFGTGTSPAELAKADEQVTDDDNGPLSSLFSLATFLPMLAAGWRRMHDTGRSGLFLFYPLFAMIGLFMLLQFTGIFRTLASADPSAAFQGVYGLILAFAAFVIALSPLIIIFWLTRPSEPGQNQYGPNPTEVTP